ncbi:unnamed protein product [Adineta ricciae]|uniref:Uncharacterized protein n=1 Tax=Adineta ricciae TaxID=249248 RepID=A0A814ZSF8_ADIRI|nr:unnamed protein product [Adineta ricciae]CAF1419889.1 unnamed protein product [Adineta ricciae]
MAFGRALLFATALFCLLMLFSTGVEGSCRAWSPELGRYANGECRTSCFSHERNAGTQSCGSKWCCVTRI